MMKKLSASLTSRKGKGLFKTAIIWPLRLITLVGVVGLALAVANQIPIATHSLMRVEPLQAQSTFCVYPLAIDFEKLKAGDVQPGEAFEGWLKDDAEAGSFGWVRWDPHSSSGSVTDLIYRLQNPCLAVTDYVNPDDPTDTSLNPGDWMLSSTGIANSSGVRAELDVLCGATTDPDYQGNKGSDYCNADAGYDGEGAPVIRIPVYQDIADTGSNLKYQMYETAIIQIVDYAIPNASELRLIARFVALGSASVQR